MCRTLSSEEDSVLPILKYYSPTHRVCASTRRAPLVSNRRGVSLPCRSVWEWPCWRRLWCSCKLWWDQPWRHVQVQMWCFSWYHDSATFRRRRILHVLWSRRTYHQLGLPIRRGSWDGVPWRRLWSLGALYSRLWLIGSGPEDRLCPIVREGFLVEPATK